MNNLLLKYVLLITYVFLLTSTGNVFSGCWDVQEISSFSFKELDGATVFSFKDAVTCAAISDVVVEIANHSFKTDVNGYVVLPNRYVESVMDGSLHMTAKKNGYCTFQKNVRVMVGTIKDKRFLMSKRLPIGKARFVLQWGKKPRDLDLHLVGNDFHISYRNMRTVAQKAMLDIDDVDSYGPETITLDKIIGSHRYDVYVHNYSGESRIDDQAYVSIYKDNQLDNIVTLPHAQKRYVKILEIRNHNVHYLNIGVDRIP
jgi:hypothetical protein